MYTKVKMPSCGYQVVLVSQYTMNVVIYVPCHKQSELGTGRGSYILVIVSPLVSVMIAKLTSLSEHCFVIALYFSCIRILLLNIFSVYYSTWTSYVNVTILQKYSGNVHKQLIPGCFLPCGLGTRLVVTHICALSASNFQRDESLYVHTVGSTIPSFLSKCFYITMTAALSSSLLYS